MNQNKLLRNSWIRLLNTLKNFMMKFKQHKINNKLKEPNQ